MLTGYYQRKQKKSFQKRLVKGNKIFLKNKKDKKDQYAYEWYKNPSEEEKQKKRQYGREWYKKNYSVSKAKVIRVSK